MDTASGQGEAQPGQIAGGRAAARHMPQAAMYQAYIHYGDINGFYELSGKKHGHSAGASDAVLRQALAAFLPPDGAKSSLNEQNSGMRVRPGRKKLHKTTRKSFHGKTLIQKRGLL